MSYKTVCRRGFGVYEEKKSVFYGAVSPAATEEDALCLLEEEKKRYPDARHHAYAYLLRDGNVTRYSDDREPQGTAGIPILDLLRKSGLTDVAVVVSRYFGGTLLGTGGLVRAYTAAAKAALSDAGTARGEETMRFRMTMPYGDYSKTPAFLEKNGAVTENVDFADAVTLYCRIAAADYAAFLKNLSEFTDGRVNPDVYETAFLLIPDEATGV